MSKYKLLNEDKHFQWRAIELMALTSNSTDVTLHCRLIVAALKLNDFDNLHNRVLSVVSSFSQMRTEKTLILKKVLYSVDCITSSELINVSLEDLHNCVNNAGNCVFLLLYKHYVFCILYFCFFVCNILLL